MQEYIVQAKDSLWKIAKTHGTTVDALAKINGIKGHRVHDLKIGQKLHVPGADHEDPDCMFKLEFRGLNSQIFTPKKVIVEHDGVKTTHDMMGKDSLMLSIADHAQGLKVWVEDLLKAHVQVMDEAVLPLGKWALSVDSRKIKIQGNMLPENGKPQATTEKVKASTTAMAQKNSGEVVQEQTRVESGAPTHALATIYTSENLRLLPANEKYRSYILAAAKKYDTTPQAIAAFLQVEAFKGKDGAWQEDSNISDPSQAQGVAQFFPDGWTDVFNFPKSLLHSDCKNLHFDVVLKKRCDSKYAIDGLAAYIEINLKYLKAKTGWSSEALPAEDKAKLAYLLHHDGIGNAMLHFGKSENFKEVKANYLLSLQLKNKKKLEELIDQYDGSAAQAYSGWLFSLIDSEINVNNFLINPNLSKKPRKIADIVGEINSQPPIPKPKPKKTKEKKNVENISTAAKQINTEPVTAVSTSMTTTSVPAKVSTVAANSASMISESGSESRWFDPLACCTIRVAGLASIMSATFGMTRIAKDGSPKGHQGLDLIAELETPIRAVANGKIVIPIHQNGDYGKNIMLIVGINDLAEDQLRAFQNIYPDENRIGFFYGHLSEFNVINGQTVHAGDIIGKTGCTGNASKMKTISTGAHLHFEVRKIVLAYPATQAYRINPLPFINNCTNRPN